jgi:hypothetical protein
MVIDWDKCNHIDRMKYLIEYINLHIDHILRNNNYMHVLVDLNKNMLN